MTKLLSNQTRRSVLRSSGLIGSTAVLSTFLGGQPASRAEPLTDLKVGISALVAPTLPVFMVGAGGLDRKHGLNVQVLNMNGGGRGVQVLMSGNIQAMDVGLGPVVQSNAQGAGLRMIASAVNVNPVVVFSSPKIKTAAQLKGGTIGISSFGSETEIAANLALLKLGLNQKDVQLIQLGGDAQRLAALMAGQVQAIPLQEPTSTKAREAGFNTLVDLPATGMPYSFDGLVTTADYIKDHREVLVRFLQAYVEGAYLALFNKKLAEQVIRTEYKMDDPNAIEATYAAFSRFMPRDAAPTQAAAQNVIQQVQKTGGAVSSTNPADYLDLSLLGDLQKSGVFDALKKAYPSP